MNKRFLVFILIILGVLSLDAQNIIRPKVDFPNGIYVNSYNGVLFYQRPDVSIRNRNLSLEAVFYYNSSFNRKNYGYGNGWSLGSELRFVNDSLGVIIEQGDGRRDLFTRYGSGFEAPAGVFSTLSVEGDGYLLTYKDGTKYYFTDTVHKQVTQLKDRYNNTLDFDYQNGRLSSITDISGRSLYFTWTDSLMTELHTSFDDRTWSYRYDDRGNLTCVTDPMGYSVYYGYNDDNRIKTFTDAEGYSTHISYNIDGMAYRVKTDLTDKAIRYELAKGQTIFIEYLKNAPNQYTKYVWDEKGRLAEIMNVNMGTSTKFTYDDDNNLVSKEDANGNVFSYTYDQNGNCLSATDPLGYTEYYTYESTFNKVTSFTDKMGHLYTYQYDSRGDLLQMNGPLNYVISFSYNEFGQAIAVTDANGNSTFYDYDTFGNLSSQTDPLGNVTSVTYNTGGLPLSQTTPNGSVTSYVFDAAEQLVESVDPLGNSSFFQYDRRGNLVGYIDALNHAYSISYNAIGLVENTLNPVGAQTRYYYSGERLVRKLDALNHATNYGYDDNNRLVMVIDAENDTTRYTYDSNGNLLGKLLSNGENIFYQYDNMGRLLTTGDQIGVVYNYSLDANGNVVQFTDALNATHYYYYDALGRLIEYKDGAGNSEYYSYDNNGNLLTYLDREGHSAIISYDANNRMVSYTDAMDYVTHYTYNEDGLMSSVTDANGHATTYEYNDRHQIVKVTFPNAKTRRFWYDANGNRVLQENESLQQTSLTYDEANRLVAQNSVGNPEDYKIFEYDLANNIISATNQDAVLTFVYDAIGRMLSESMNGAITSYAYNTREREKLITYPSGKQVKETYDHRSRVTNISEDGSVLASYEYNNANEVLTRCYSNNMVTNYSYNEVGRLVQLSDNVGGIDVQFEYDKVGNMLKRKDLLHEENSQLFQYDPTSRLINYQQGIMNENGIIPDPIKNTHYQLDGLGNRISVLDNGLTTNYETNAVNAYTSMETGGVTTVCDYDDKGNLISDGTHTYQYDYQNRLISVDNGNSVEYKYDAFGRLIQRKVNKDRQIQDDHYYYSHWRMIEEIPSNPQLCSSFVYGQNQKDLFWSESFQGRTFYQNDQSFSTVAAVDEMASILEEYRYGPYGEVHSFDDSGAPIGFSQLKDHHYYNGNPMDDETLLYRIQDRNLHPQQGRYVQQNPTNYNVSMNTYEVEVPTGIEAVSSIGDGIGATKEIIGVITVDNYGKIRTSFDSPNGGVYRGGGRGKLKVDPIETTTLGKAAKVVNAVGDVITVGSAVVDAYNLYEARMNNPNMSGAEEGELYGEFAGKVLVGYAGAAVGAKAGAALGAAVGSIVPGVGTVVGAIVGGALGGAIGGVIGSKLGQKILGKIGKGIGGLFDKDEPENDSGPVCVPSPSPVSTPVTPHSSMSVQYVDGGGGVSEEFMRRYYLQRYNELLNPDGYGLSYSSEYGWKVYQLY